MEAEVEDAGAHERVLPALAVIITFPGAAPLATTRSFLFAHIVPSPPLPPRHLRWARSTSWPRLASRRRGSRVVAPLLYPPHPTRVVPVPSPPPPSPCPSPSSASASASIAALPRLGCALADVRDVEAGVYGCASHPRTRHTHAPAFTLAALVPVIGFKTPRRAAAPRAGVYGAPAQCTRRPLLPRAVSVPVPVIGRARSTTSAACLPNSAQPHWYCTRTSRQWCMRRTRVLHPLLLPPPPFSPSLSPPPRSSPTVIVIFIDDRPCYAWLQDAAPRTKGARMQTCRTSRHMYTPPSPSPYPPVPAFTPTFTLALAVPVPALVIAPIAAIDDRSRRWLGFKMLPPSIRAEHRGGSVPRPRPRSPCQRALEVGCRALAGVDGNGNGDRREAGRWRWRCTRADVEMETARLRGGPGSLLFPLRNRPRLRLPRLRPPTFLALQITPALSRQLWVTTIPSDRKRAHLFSQTAFDIFLGFCANLGFYQVRRFAWRLLLGSAFRPAVPLMFGVYLCPDMSSILYHNLHETCEEGALPGRQRLLQEPAKHRGKRPVICTTYVHRQLMERFAVLRAVKYFTHFFELFTIPRVRRALLAAFVVMIAQQMCGMDVPRYGRQGMSNGTFVYSLNHGTDVTMCLIVQIFREKRNFLLDDPAAEGDQRGVDRTNIWLWA
ncbi:hypothetical protein B0H13DRAFT_2298480 [Mycena leptocephala]|nr:hypothetical protein B0H13DRAFT_2298480 [Mycena leptocephala]